MGSMNLHNPALLGANKRAEGIWDFLVWAPKRQNASLHLLGPNDRFLSMTKDQCGYHHAAVPNLDPHTRYFYRLEGTEERPDPASRFQPEGVHGPSEIFDLDAFVWTDAQWKAPSLKDSIYYELHIGTFSEQGTLNSVIPRFAELSDLGVTTIELMPVAQFPGSRNWGYDGVYPYAVQNSYGGPLALQRFVNAAHERGLAVCLDVVYNHLGPEGNYLASFAPYFSSRYRTPWGEAINFDGPESGPVRRYFIENAIYWFEKFHVDSLRLDAIHGIFDFSARHILAELEDEVRLASRRLGRDLCLIAESDLNDSRILLPGERGGYGLPAQWSDDFHHSVHTLLTGESQGYYADFGGVTPLAVTLRDGWYYHGQYSRFRRRRHGNSASGISRSHFVAYTQNHDQVGNRASGERLSSLVNFEAQKLAAGLTLLSPFVPLLFMGEEYGETSPFLYFTSHGDKELIEAVRRGRREEFAEFGWHSDVPDPQNEATFAKSKLHDNLRDTDPHRALWNFHRELIRFRRANRLGEDADLEITDSENPPILTLKRCEGGRVLFMIFNFARSEAALETFARKGSWNTELYSADARWLGASDDFPRTLDSTIAITLSPQSFLVLSQEAG